MDACRTGAGPDTIVLPAGTYWLTRYGASEDAGQTGDLDVLTDVTIRGAGRAATIVDATTSSSYDLGDRVIHVLAAGRLTLSGATLRGG